MAIEVGASSISVGDRVSLFVLSSLLSGHQPIGRNLEFNFHLGLATLREAVGANSRTTVRIGNPAIECLYRSSTPSVEFAIGQGFALPLAMLGDRPYDGASTLGLAMAIDGNRNRWLWLPDAFSIYVPVRVAWTMLPRLRLESEAAAVTYVSSANPGVVALGFQGLVGLAYAVGRSWFGLNVQGTTFVVEGDQDLTQVALVPRTHLDFGGWFTDARFVLNIDPPLGFAFDDGGIWGLFIAFGVET